VTDGFFDAGMLLQALKSKEEETRGARRQSIAHRRSVGKKLALSEY
jgi:carnitine O-acetyltransferase